MNTRTPLIRAVLAAALAGSAFMLVHSWHAVPAVAAVSMSVEARAPMHAILLPTVSVVASAGNPDQIVAMRIGSSAPLPVTLMPTVSASARLEDFAATSTPKTFLTRDEGATRVELAAMAPALRARGLPR